jgi:hypothetical protein
MQVLNDLLTFIGHTGGQKFTMEDVSDIQGFNTPYTNAFTEDDKQAIREMREFYKQPNKDLQTLMNTYFPNQKWQGLQCVLSCTMLYIYPTSSYKNCATQWFMIEPLSVIS